MLRLTRYTKAAMQHATYEHSTQDQSYHGEIPGLPGLRSQAATLDSCRVALRDKLASWLLLRLCLQLPIPSIEGMPLNAWIWIQRGV